MTNNERALDFWAKLAVVLAVFMLGFSFGYYQASRDALNLWRSSDVDASASASR